ncbi:MAG: hypothetical protein WCT37_02995 [Patescibacteria group bacterium]|jgi:hypothetical protein
MITVQDIQAVCVWNAGLAVEFRQGGKIFQINGLGGGLWERFPQGGRRAVPRAEMAAAFAAAATKPADHDGPWSPFAVFRHPGSAEDGRAEFCSAGTLPAQIENHPLVHG